MANSKQPVVIKNTSPYGVQLYTEDKKVETDVIIEPVLQEKTIVPNKETQEVTADDGYAGIGKLNIEPIPEEYIIPQGSVTITENKTVDVTQYKTAIVNIPTGSDNPLTATTNTEMVALLVTENVGKVARFNGTSSTYEEGRYYLIEEILNNVSYSINLSNYPYNGDSTLYAKFYDGKNNLLETIEFPITSDNYDVSKEGTISLPTSVIVGLTPDYDCAFNYIKYTLDGTNPNSSSTAVTVLTTPADGWGQEYLFTIDGITETTILTIYGVADN